MKVWSKYYSDLSPVNDFLQFLKLLGDVWSLRFVLEVYGIYLVYIICHKNTTTTNKAVS